MLMKLYTIESNETAGQSRGNISYGTKCVLSTIGDIEETIFILLLVIYSRQNSPCKHKNIARLYQKQDAYNLNGKNAYDGHFKK